MMEYEWCRNGILVDTLWQSNMVGWKTPPKKNGDVVIKQHHFQLILK